MTSSVIHGADARLPHVFERFRQADAGSTWSCTGIGLGLAIAKHFVELHGGTIWVESPSAPWSTSFTVEIPLVAGTERPHRTVRHPWPPRTVEHAAVAPSANAVRAMPPPD